MIMEYKKKLIEVALPLEAINAASIREKSIRHGHPSTLHLWWARRPLAAARAVIWASLVDDPSSHPELWPTEEEQQEERERLNQILSEQVKWENSNNPKVLAAAKAEMLKYNLEGLPAFLDPFAGGGSIPLEAQRLGLEAHASDLNPVAVLINKAMIEIPPMFTGQPPVNPEALHAGQTTWPGTSGLAEDVRYYGEWLKQKAFERIGHLYPKVKDEHGQELTVIAWLWTRTVKCPNPACGCQMPLTSSFVLSKKKGNEAYVQPIIEGTNIRYEVRKGTDAPDPPKTGRGQFCCICCGEPVKADYVRNEFQAKQNGSQLMAIVCEGSKGRVYLTPDREQINLVEDEAVKPEWLPEAEMNQNCTNLISGRGYGYTHWHELFTNRQLNMLTTLSNLIPKTIKQAETDAWNKGLSEDNTSLISGVSSANSYSQAIGVYLSFIVSKMTDYHSSICTWHSSRDVVRNTFARQAIPMVWDYAEANPFSNSSGCLDNMLEWITKSINNLPVGSKGMSKQIAVQRDNGLRDILVSTDPPYYDNIGYADLSDFFYIWLRQSLKNVYPDLFQTMLVPKAEELVAIPYRFEGGKQEAKEFFESGMLKAFEQIHKYVNESLPLTVYYAFKQSETETDHEGSDQTASSGWETMLAALIKAGFSITGTWPIRTELANRSLAMNTNALASSIVLVCRKRPSTLLATSRRDFVNTLRQELVPAIKQLQASNLAPVDLAQSAIGPGMSVFSRYTQVLEADGTPMTVRTALQIINQEIDAVFAEQEGDIDGDSRFCLDLYSQYAFGEMKFGEADVLARAKNTSVSKLVSDRVVVAQRGIVRLLKREEITGRLNPKQAWSLTQRLTHTLDKEGNTGVAQLMMTIVTARADLEKARTLAYRLYILAERKGWTSEANVYNSLVIAWPDIQSKLAELMTGQQKPIQGRLEDV